MFWWVLGVGGGGMVNPCPSLVDLPLTSVHIVTTQNRDCLPTHLKYSGEGVFTRREILLCLRYFLSNEEKSWFVIFQSTYLKKCRPWCTCKKLDLSVYPVLIWIFFLGRYLGSETTSHFILALHFFIVTNRLSTCK